jgi:hypothetical protein
MQDCQTSSLNAALGQKVNIQASYLANSYLVFSPGFPGEKKRPGILGTGNRLILYQYFDIYVLRPHGMRFAYLGM